MGAIALGKEILVIDTDHEIVIEGDSGTITSDELALVNNDNAFYFTHSGDKLRLSKISATINTYICVGEPFVWRVIILNKLSGDWTYQEFKGSTIQTELPTEDGPNDGQIREVLVPITQKGAITEYKYYNYLYYEEA